MSESSSPSVAASSVDGDQNENETLANDLVVTKYMMAGEITNRVLKEVAERCVHGASIKDTCVFGDRRIDEEVSLVFKKNKSMKKGFSMPTCISLNNQLAFYSPLRSDPDMTMNNGDIVKIELGCHIDGYPSMVAHTTIVGIGKNSKVSGRKADAVLAAYYAMEAATKLIRPDITNREVAKRLSEIVAAYDCGMIDGWTSYELGRNECEGEKYLATPGRNVKADTQDIFKFEPNEVYAVDIAVTTGEGKVRDSGLRTTVFRKKNMVYALKVKASRMFLHEIEHKYGLMHFNLRGLENETTAKLGVTECLNHALVDAFPVTVEKEGEFVARFKTTLLLLPSSQRKSTGIGIDTELYESEHQLTDPTLKELLTRTTTGVAARRKRKRKAKHVAQANGVV